eukprot:6553079-Pyramimonas_sp.AAC.1
MVHRDMQPDEKVTRLQEPDQLRGYALCRLKLTTARGPVHLVNVYVPPKNACEMEGEPTKTTVRQYVLRELKEWMCQMCTDDTPVIVGGDYNET